MKIFAVVPIFTSAGAALLPTILAALASLAAVAFKPREVLRLCRQRPVAASLSAGVIALSLALTTWWLASGTAPRSASRSEARATARYDWARVAEQLLAQERAGKTPTSLAALTDVSADVPIDSQVHSPVAAPADQNGSNAPLVLGHDFTRCCFSGGPSPVQLKPRWSFQPEDTMFISTPLVAGQRIFAAGCQSELGSYVGLLACLDTATGQPLWQITQAGSEDLRPFFSSPALTADGRYLVIGQGLHTDRDCALLCFDATTGRLRWAVKTTLHIESSPAIFGDLAVVGAGAIEGPDGRPVSDPGFVVAVRIEDGRELWRQPVNDPESSPAVGADGLVYIGSGFNGNAVVALHSEADEQLREKQLARVAWRTPLALPVTSAITLVGDLVIAGAGNGSFVHSHPQSRGLVVALDRRTGEICWQTSLDDAVMGPIAGRDGILICPSRTGEVTALALEDGQVRWRTSVSGKSPVLAGCAFTGQRIYAVSSDGYLAVLDPKDGKVLEKTYLNDQAKPGSGLTLAAPQIAGGRVVVGSETGGLHCLVGSGSIE